MYYLRHLNIENLGNLDSQRLQEMKNLRKKGSHSLKILGKDLFKKKASGKWLAQGGGSGFKGRRILTIKLFHEITVPIPPFPPSKKAALESLASLTPH
jgi:hypothetical protein